MDICDNNTRQLHTCQISMHTMQQPMSQNIPMTPMMEVYTDKYSTEGSDSNKTQK